MYFLCTSSSWLLGRRRCYQLQSKYHVIMVYYFSMGKFIDLLFFYEEIVFSRVRGFKRRVHRILIWGQHKQMQQVETIYHSDSQGSWPATCGVTAAGNQFDLLIIYILHTTMWTGKKILKGLFERDQCCGFGRVQCNLLQRDGFFYICLPAPWTKNVLKHDDGEVRFLQVKVIIYLLRCQINEY